MSGATTPTAAECAALDERDLEPRTPMKRLGSTRKLAAFSTRQLFKEISVRLIDVSGDPWAGAHFGQRLSLAIQRGNAASLLGTLPCEHSDLGSIFYII
ncbi:hypothetical protein RR48_05684 [Papilio machaon]|uniref:Uncharacterized protein n=1 Tax=Papilio machaon TaxID=76193 RepID=A0A0N1IAL5_PAPMA|nr:hypothetical protein RR48_05684 [Papilio machaon]